MAKLHRVSTLEADPEMLGTYARCCRLVESRSLFCNVACNGEAQLSAISCMSFGYPVSAWTRRGYCFGPFFSEVAQRKRFKSCGLFFLSFFFSRVRRNPILWLHQRCYRFTLHVIYTKINGWRQRNLQFIGKEGSASIHPDKSRSKGFPQACRPSAQCRFYQLLTTHAQ